MAIFRDANLNVIATNGEAQPSSAANSPSPQAKSVPASLNAGSTSTTDFQVFTATTLQPVADRA